ncbi:MULTISPECIES: FadR/GntR family transcriptional regulator [Microbacterium]|uniref:FadR/GntR family transcriptional regulator n=1 Tax=Microbacterium TaxID=33882 RepID=UPI0024AFF35D|nr:MULTISPECIES: FadR/GntR family transcriptional regulator [Microbacterium]MDI6944783.1 FadR/GntR family transcriptional regulator [Microbacterium barkeri]WRH16799.1 FCD domain-containing protein [Microbacterium sp. JZ37]
MPDEWTSRPAPVVRRSVAESVIEDLRGAITSGALAVGTRLPSEALLAERYAVSRPVIREALRSLQTLGLTQTRTGSGTYVTADRIDPATVYGEFSARDLMEARPHIEVPAAGLAAERRTDEQRDELTALCDAMDACDDPQEWVALDTRFHSLVAQASGNAVFAKAVSDIRDALSRQSQVVNLVASRQEPSGREHRRIAEAIAVGSPIEAREAMRAHLGEVERVVIPLTRPAARG